MASKASSIVVKSPKGVQPAPSSKGAARKKKPASKGKAGDRGGVDRSDWATAGELADRTLLFATRSGRFDKAELALVWGANPDRLDNANRTALERAAFYGHRDVCDLLIKHGCDIFVRDELKQTTILKAASWGKTNVVELLMSHGASLQDRDIFGMTPLLRAAYAAHPDTVAFCLRRGADVFATDNHGRNAVDLAKYWRKPGDIKLVANVPKVVEMLEADIAKKTAVKEEEPDSDGWSDRDPEEAKRESEERKERQARIARLRQKVLAGNVAGASGAAGSPSEDRGDDGSDDEGGLGLERGDGGADDEDGGHGVGGVGGGGASGGGASAELEQDSGATQAQVDMMKRVVNAMASDD